MLPPEAVAVAAGILAHQLIFIHGEWHLKGPRVVVLHIAIATSLYSASLFLCPDSRKNNVNRVTYSVICYYLSLPSSIGVYRIFFHRLKQFPGPKLAALTKLWHVWKCRDSRGHLVLQSWYEQYGEFVRTGPGEITIFHSEAYEAMDGVQNRNTRSDWYDLLHPRMSSIFTRDKNLHNERRKMWEQPLSTKSLQQYHRRVIEKVHTLENFISAEDSKPVLVNDLMYFFAFDSMGDFAFSEDFGMMRTKQWHTSIAMLRSALTLLGPFSPAIWIPRLAFAFIPGVWKVRHWFHMLELCDECMARRMKEVLSDRDIASWFIEDHEKHESDPTWARWLSGDTATLVVAGRCVPLHPLKKDSSDSRSSDTTAPSLTHLFYFLARYPNHAQKIHKELQEINIEEIALLSTLPHLNGTINEAMRLLPAVLTFSSRVTPPEGLMIDGMFIPANTKICAPRYTIGRRTHPIPFPSHCTKAQADKTQAYELCWASFGTRTDPSCLCFFGIEVSGEICARRRGWEAVERNMRDQLTAQPGACWVVFERR
ncbi:cytochrome P450 [Penicillium antarcticum]|uniref:cytochrome P450 n=1 Tax=Penicillium antarcticum TaxID=416450 RepID=UPI0023944812|nr:cytochrome P450 [Penicillium antarcticum]KAJ5305867.1 cytochrome P450 [Penicillium antarcticum]